MKLPSFIGQFRFLSKAAEARQENFFEEQEDFRDPRLLRHTLEQLVFTRIFTLTLVLTMVLASVLTTVAPDVGKIQAVCWSIAVVFAVSIGNLFLLRRIRDEKIRLFAVVQFGIDVLFATGTVAVASTTVAIFLYLFLIIAAALVLGRKESVLLAAESGIAYSFLSGWLYTTGRALTFLDVLSVYLALVSVAVLSSYLAKRFEIVGQLAKEQAKSLSQLRGERAGIFEDLSEGVVLLDGLGGVVEMNPAARNMLGLDAAGFLGKSLSEILRPQLATEENQNLGAWLSKESQGDIRLRSKDSSELRHVSYSTRRLTDGQGDSREGMVVVFSDRSRERTIEERLELHERMAALLAEEHNGEADFSRQRYADMAGESPIMKKVFELVERVASSQASVLIEGESGTGKELIARAIHQQGTRGERSFVAINCGALPENLIESELFGHKRGAFTGASQDSMGLFRQAQGGTIFLDEIGELPLHLQTKLLRVLQEKTVRAVGDTKDYAVDVRVVAATNRDLRAEVKQGRFREDLYYRLNVVNISVPPLRDRKGDIPLLVKHFFGRFCKGNPYPQLSPEALQLLMQYPFPGNIRELENIIERALVLGGTAILPEHLPEELRRRSEDSRNALGKETSIVTLPIDLERELESLERAYLLRALNESQGVKKAAAEMLGLNFRSFRYRLKKYSLASEAGSNDEEAEEEHSLER